MEKTNPREPTGGLISLLMRRKFAAYLKGPILPKNAYL